MRNGYGLDTPKENLREDTPTGFVVESIGEKRHGKAKGHIKKEYYGRFHERVTLRAEPK